MTRKELKQRFGLSNALVTGVKLALGCKGRPVPDEVSYDDIAKAVKLRHRKPRVVK